MIISCIGDSLTEGDYGIPGKSGIANVHEKNYPYFLQKLTNAEVRNFGYCGFRSTNILEYCKQGKIDVKGSQIIIIMLGTNGGQTALGTSIDDKAYLEIIDFCHINAPDAIIYLATPPNVTTNPIYSNCGYIGNVIPARDYIRKVSKELNLPIIELDKSDKFVPENEHIYQVNDGLHFVEPGYQELALEIFEVIKQSL